MYFSWDEDTGDEIQILAESFGSLTDRMKQYIRDITEITKEKERIGAELNVATRIQASMLPTDFDKYDDLKRFTLFASMDSAKEVGGDFYDFFMVDDKRIALVMADVSGKGVPFREHEVKFEPGDTVFVYTDGVTEATNLNNELFGDDRVIAALNHDPDADPKDLLPTVRRDIDEFVGEASQFDDITMLAFRLD